MPEYQSLTPPRETAISRSSSALYDSPLASHIFAYMLTEVKPGVPHFYLTVDVEMDAALAIRAEAKALDTKISVNDVIVKAVAVALRRFPRLNQQFAGDRILQLHNVDVGVAVAIEDGLITPIVRDADQKGLAQISAEVRDLEQQFVYTQPEACPNPACANRNRVEAVSGLAAWLASALESVVVPCQAWCCWLRQSYCWPAGPVESGRG